MRRPLVAGNWKMHGSIGQVESLIEALKLGVKEQSYADIDILVCPSFVHLTKVRHLLENTPIMYGAQNLYIGTQGAFTGEISGSMLADIDCDYVLVGHSERRAIFHEDLALIAAKVKSSLEAGVKPILCVGESKTEREQGLTESIIREQLLSVIDSLGPDVLREMTIAYEPVWAIGTGLTATPEQAQSVHAFIRGLIAQNNVDIAKTIRILYGGSVKADNAAALFEQPDIDGGLIGGASLDASSFLSICTSAKNSIASEHSS